MKQISREKMEKLLDAVQKRAMADIAVESRYDSQDRDQFIYTRVNSRTFKLLKEARIGMYDQLSKNLMSLLKDSNGTVYVINIMRGE